MHYGIRERAVVAAVLATILVGMLPGGNWVILISVLLGAVLAPEVLPSLLGFAVIATTVGSSLFAIMGQPVAADRLADCSIIFCLIFAGIKAMQLVAWSKVGSRRGR